MRNTLLRYFIIGSFVLIFMNFLTNGSLYSAVSRLIVSESATSSYTTPYRQSNPRVEKVLSFNFSEGTPFQKVAGIMVCLGMVILSIVWLWLLVNAFLERVPWGLSSLLIPPIAFFYGLMFYEDNRWPIHLTVLAGGLIGVGFILLLILSA